MAAAPPANPCTQLEGYDPQGHVCGECANLRALRLQAGGTFYFCARNEEPRRITSPACTQFLAPPPAISRHG